MLIKKNNFLQVTVPDNLFINYLSRIHRDEDFHFVLRGFTKLLNNPLVQTYLPNSTKKVQFHQELLVFFWKMCDYNKVMLTSELNWNCDILLEVFNWIILYRIWSSHSDRYEEFCLIFECSSCCVYLYWLFRVPSFAADFFNILNFNFLFPSHTHYMFRPLWAILR
jgi:hypothetical protein